MLARSTGFSTTAGLLSASRETRAIKDVSTAFDGDVGFRCQLHMRMMPEFRAVSRAYSSGSSADSLSLSAARFWRALRPRVTDWRRVAAAVNGDAIDVMLMRLRRG